MTAPTITSNGAGDIASILVFTGSTAVTTVTATDLDLPTQLLTYSIAGGADSAKFAIHSSSGALTFISPPLFTQPQDVGVDNVYDVVVQVSDSLGEVDVQSLAIAINNLVPITGGRDLIYDHFRQQLLVTTSTGTVARFNEASLSVVGSYAVGASLNGGDITPDGGYLYVTEGTANTSVIHKVNLSNGSKIDLPYSPAPISVRGGWDLAMTNDGRAIFTTNDGSSSDSLRQIILATDAITNTTHEVVGRETQIARGADYSKLLFFTSGSPREMFSYTGGGGFSSDVQVDVTLTNCLATVNRNGTLFAIKVRGQIAILDTSFQAITQLNELRGGVIFHPTQDLLLAVDIATDEVVAFDTSTWQTRYRLPIGADVSESISMGAGVMAISADGNRLYLNTPTGVRLINLPAATGSAANVTFSDYGNYVAAGTPSSITVTMRDSTGAVATRYRGSVQFAGSDITAGLPASYQFTAADAGKHTFTFILNSAGNQTVTVTDLALPTLSGTVSIQVHTGATTLIPTVGARDLIFDSLRQRLYITTSNQQVQRYDLATDSLLAPWNFSSPIYSADTNVAQSALYVQNGLRNVHQSMIQKVDLDTGNTMNILYDIGGFDAGGRDLSIAADGIAYASTECLCTGGSTLWKLDTATDTVSLGLSNFGPNTNISRGVGRQQLMLQIPSSSGGNVRYYTAGGALSKEWGAYVNFLDSQGTVSPDGSYYALELKDSIAIYGNAFPFPAVRSLLNVTGGLVFHPTQNILLAVDAGNNQVVGFDTTTWSERYRLDIGENVGDSVAWGPGVTAVTPDGSRMFLATSEGVRVIPLPAVSSIPNNVLLTDYSQYLATGASTQITVTIRDPAGNAVSGYRGTVGFSSSDSAAGLPANYTFTAADAGSHTFVVSLNTAGSHTISILDLATPSLTKTTASIQVHAAVSTLLPIAGAKDLIFDSLRNVLYMPTSSGQIQRYSLTTDSLLEPWNVSHSLLAGDITATNSALFIQEGTRNFFHATVHRIDLTTGAVLDLTYQKDGYESNGYDLAIDSSGIAHLNGRLEGLGSVPMRLLDTATNVFSVSSHDIAQDTPAIRNNNRTVLAFAEINKSPTTVFTYDVGTHTYSDDERINRIVSTAFTAVNDGGTAVAITYNNASLEIRGADLGLVKTVSSAFGGLAFKPGTNQLIAADRNSQTIKIYDDDDDWKLTGSFPIGESLGTPALLGSGTIGFSADGSRLFLITPTGVRVFNTEDTERPTVTDWPAGQSLLEGETTGALEFTVDDNLTPEDQLAFSISSSNPFVLPNSSVILGGLGPNRTLTITPPINSFGGPVTITLTITDKAGNFRQVTLPVTITGINDPPSFATGVNPIVAADSGAITVPNWATGISAGPNETTQIVSFQVTGNSNAALFSTPPAISANGALTFTPAAGTTGTATITFHAKDNGETLLGGIDVSPPQTFVITVRPEPLLRATSFVATNTGFVLDFNRAIDPTILNLYSTQGGLGPADLVLQGAVSGTIRGSLVPSTDLRRLTFVGTSGILPADNYTLTLRSATDAVRDDLLAILDGDSNGVAGGNYVRAFSVATQTGGVIVSMPNIARGPEQAINFPADEVMGTPVILSNGAGITSAIFQLHYDPALLSITGATVAAELPGASVSINTVTPGMATIQFYSPTPLAAGIARIVELQTAVPAAAPYRMKQVVDIAQIVLNGGSVLAVDDDAVQVVAFFADVSGNGTYSAQDASYIARLAVGIDTGLEDFALLDPTIIGDITGNGAFSATDSSLMLQAAVGIEVPEIPTPLPSVSLTHGGPDPKLSIPQNLVATAGGSLAIPVNIDSIVNLTGNGLASADLVIYYDPAVFEVTSATLGRLVGQRGWIISSRIDPLAGRIDLSLAGTRPLEGQFLGELVQLHAAVKSNAPAGASAINLAATSRSRSTQLNEGFLTLIPAPTDAANDSIDGRVTIRANDTTPAIENTARLIGEQLLITGSRGDDRILVGHTFDGRLRVRIGNQFLGDFAVPAGIAVDALTGNDFVYVAPFAPLAVISANLSVHDHIFGDQNSRVIDDANELADSDLSAQQSAVVHREALLQLLTAWQAESDTDEVSPRHRSVRRLL